MRVTPEPLSGGIGEPVFANGPSAASAGRRLALSVALLAPYLFGRAWIASTWPYQQGFDDFDHIPAALEWAQHQRLTRDGLFLRVPLWHILLGSFFLVFGTTAGLFVLQASIVWGTLLAYLTYVERVLHRDAWGILLLPPLVFVSSPQVLLYGRHAVNEPFLGLLAVPVERRAATMVDTPRSSSTNFLQRKS